jgi:PAS domain S-box-containing protein
VTHPQAIGEPEAEVARLRGGFNDLVSVVALSAAWAGRDAAEIGRMLGEALVALLRLDFALVELAPDEGVEQAFACLAGGSGSGDALALAQDIRRVCGGVPSAWPDAVRGELDGGEVSLVVLPLGAGGIVAAAAARPGFPDDVERLLLNVARNQALLALQDAQRRSEEHLRASELSATALIEGIPGLVAILGPDGRVERVNGRIVAYCGQSLDELRDWGTNGTVHPEDMPHVAAIFGSSIASGTPYDIEQRLRRFDGAYRWFRNQGSPLRDEAGTIVAWHVLLTDIDDRKRAEDSLRASERELRQQVETFPQMLWSATADGNIDYCNERLLDYSGLAAERVRNGGWVELLHPDDRAPTAAVWMRCIATGEPYSVEVRHYHRADRSHRWNLVMALPLRDGEGRIVKWYGSCVDIHDLKRAEQAVKASERHLAQIIDTIPANVWSTDAEGGADFYNRHYLQYLGLPIEELRGSNWASVVHPDDLARQLSAWRQALQSGRPFESQTRVRRSDGTYRWFLHRASALEDADGRTRWFGISIDIEDMKRAEERLRQSELDLRRQTETIPQNLFGADASGSVNYLNTQMREWFGRAEETIMAEEWVHLVHPDDRDATVAAWMGTVAAGTPYRHEVRFIDRNGEYRWCEVRARPLRDTDGTITAWYGVVNDIHDRKLAEDALKASEQNLRLTIDTIPALAWSARADGTADFFSRQYLDYAGRTPDDVRDWRWVDLVHPDDLPTIAGTWEDCRQAGVGAEVEARLRRHDGTYRWFLFQTNPLRDESGEVVKWYGVNTDIEDAKRAALLLADERTLLELIASGRPLLEVLGRLCRVVEAALPGVVCEIRTIEATGTVFEHVVAPSLPAGFAEALTRSPLQADASPCDLAVSANAAVAVEDIEGDPRWAGAPAAASLAQHGLRSVLAGPITSRAGRILGCLGIYRRDGAEPPPGQQDVFDRSVQIASIAIERWRAEDDLRRSRFLLETSERLSETGSFSWDLVNDKLVWSEGMHRIWEVDGAMELCPPNLMPTVHPEDRGLVESKIARIFSGENIPENEERIVMPDGRVKWLATSTLLFNHEDGRRECVGVAQDITRRRAAEDALDRLRSDLAHVTRVTSLGELTASIAHEVNQPLAGIITNASTGLRMLTADPPDVEGAIRTAQRTLRDGNRASQVIQRLRGLFRKQDFSPEPFDLVEAGQEVLAICAHDLQRRRIALATDFGPALPPVFGDRIQLQQVILNLILNAADALAAVEQASRRIFVATGREDAAFARFTVRDTGAGIAADDVAKIFDAFFTTKANGMGVGLSVSSSILDRHGGRLWVAPTEGPGTTFAFTVPFASDAGGPQS